MELRFCLIGSALSAALLFSTAEAASAQLTGVDTESFRQIEQPIGLKAGITAAGVTLMGFELWWFLFSKARSRSEQAAVGEQDLMPEVLAVDVVASEQLEAEELETEQLEAESPQEVVESIQDNRDMPTQGLIELRRTIEAYLDLDPRSLRDQIATNIHTACSGIQIPQGVLIVEEKVRPRFSTV